MGVPERLEHRGGIEIARGDHGAALPLRLPLPLHTHDIAYLLHRQVERVERACLQFDGP